MSEQEIIINEWVGCYRGGWKGVIIDGAFAHPAKVAFNLARRIYEHAIEEEWIASGDTVVDPFGGIGGCAFHGLMNGMRVVTCELEQKFVDLSKENRELWREKFTGLPGFNADNWIILQGDSRKLSFIIGEAALSLSSPPYARGCAHTGGDDPKPEQMQGGDYHSVGLHLGVSSPPYAAVSPEKSSRSVDYKKQYETYRSQGGGASFEKFVATQELHSQGYGSSDGQLGAMTEGQVGLAISSPPYIESLKPETGEQTARKQQRIAESKSIYDGRKLEEPSAGKAGLGGGYGTSDGNLGAMPPGDLCVSSPPFPQPYSSGGGINTRGYGKDGADKVGSRTYQSQGGDRAEGNLETLETGSVDLAITSPPYNPPMSQDYNGSRGGKRGTEPSETGAFVKYGTTEGQIEGLSMEGFADACVSSPPFENVEGTIGSRKHKDPAAVAAKREADFRSGKAKGNFASKEAILAQMERENDRTYGETEGQLGIEKGDTFWSASRTILEQLYSVLMPGTHAIFIVKAFVRNKQIVDFPGQWAQLCEAVGFKLIHDHHALLTEHSGTQGGMFGEDREIKVKRVSFFRRLHERRAPETEIFYENVLCFERPL